MSKRQLRVLALIAARAGSRGLRDKNVQRVAGKSLLARAIELALGSNASGEQWSVVVSTESRRYATLARAAGAEVPFVRPRRLATSSARLIDVVLHALDALEARGRTFDVVVLLSATTPLTRRRDVREVLQTFATGRGESVVTVVEDHTSPSWRFGLEGGCVLTAEPGRRVQRRQQGPARYLLNGAVYAATPGWLRAHRQFVVPGKTRAVITSKERSLDIEDELDLEVADLRLRRRPPRRRG